MTMLTSTPSKDKIVSEGARYIACASLPFS